MDRSSSTSRDRPPSFRITGLVPLLIETFKSWSNHRAPKMGAALSYYTAFSLAPLVTLILSVASLTMQTSRARGEIIDQFTNLVGDRGGAAVREILDHASEMHGASWGTVVSFVILLIGASGAFGELQDSLNQIWEVPAPKRPWLEMLKDRGLSFAMVFILGFFMLVSLVLSALIAAISAMVATHFPAVGLEIINTLISFFIFTCLFAIIFQILPDVRLFWSDVWPGAVFSAVLFIIGKFLIGLYIGQSSVFSTYGAAGSFVVTMLWVFYSAQILFLGAEFTRCYTLRYGSLWNKSEAPPKPKRKTKAKP